MNMSMTCWLKWPINGTSICATCVRRPTTASTKGSEKKQKLTTFSINKFVVRISDDFPERGWGQTQWSAPYNDLRVMVVTEVMLVKLEVVSMIDSRLS